MTPKTVKTEVDHGGHIDYKDVGLPAFVYTDDKSWDDRIKAIIAAGACIPGTSPPEFACWNGHEFECISGGVSPGEISFSSFFSEEEHSNENVFLLHYPIDPRITVVDVQGATVAYPNETGTAWLFGHCDADCMIDHEYELSAAVISSFAPAVDSALVKIHEATNTVVQTQALGLYSCLVAFREEVTAAVLKEARGRHIGWYEQNPHEAHVHLPIRRAVEATTAVWQSTRRADYLKINTPLGLIVKALNKLHPYETRWAQATRLEAERKAKEAAETETAPSENGSS